jgi:hypothetical protein
MTIEVQICTDDMITKVRSFRTLEAAKAFAQKWGGAHPTIHDTYAIDKNGTDIRCTGCTLSDLFPA